MSSCYFVALTVLGLLFCFPVDYLVIVFRTLKILILTFIVPQLNYKMWNLNWLTETLFVSQLCFTIFELICIFLNIFAVHMTFGILFNHWRKYFSCFVISGAQNMDYWTLFDQHQIFDRTHPPKFEVMSKIHYQLRMIMSWGCIWPFFIHCKKRIVLLWRTNS